MSGTAFRRGGSSSSDFRPPEYPADRVLALEAVIEAMGNKLPEPPVCHGYVNGCVCPVCEKQAIRNKPLRSLAA